MGAHKWRNENEKTNIKFDAYFMHDISHAPNDCICSG